MTTPPPAAPTRIVPRAKIVAERNALAKMLRDLVGLAEMSAGKLHLYKAALDDARALLARIGVP